MHRSCSWALAISVSIATGCLTHRGGAWRAEDNAPVASTATASVVFLGDAGAPGRRGAHVATRLQQTLDEERAQGRVPVVVWLGNMMLDSRGRPDCEANPHADLAAVVRAHQRAGGASFALPGEAEYQCGARERQRTAADQPWETPGVHFVIALGPRGQTSLVTRCADATCTDPAPMQDAVTELVFADLTPWIAGARPAQTDPDLRALDALLDQLRTRPGPPRVLVTHYPLEAGGRHGQGGADPDSSLHTMPPELTVAVAQGMFAGSVAAHDRTSYVASDLSDAAIRSDRVFLQRPVFEVVTGTATLPDGRPGAATSRLRFNNSIAHAPVPYTPRAGYAVLRFGQGQLEAELLAGRGKRWQHARVPLQLRPPAHPLLTSTPTTAPCLRCPRLPISER